MEKLNQDIIQEIVSRLPKNNTGIQSVLQCRKVCRIWRRRFGKPKIGTLFSILPDEGPIKIHYGEQSGEMVNFNCTKRLHNGYNIITNINRMNTRICCFHLVGSCNGLVCYEACNPHFVMYVFNPVTGERIRVPDMGERFSHAGFGYCRHSMYKVVRICKQRVQVYTLGDGSGWRDKQEIPDTTTCTFHGLGVFANGAVHWLKTGYNSEILAFDLTDEKFRSLPSPPCRHILSKPYVKINFGSLGGNLLYLCLRYREQDEHMMDIWVTKKKNLNNCRYSSRMKEHLYSYEFIWIKEFSRKWDLDLNKKCHLVSLTESEILLWQHGILYCYDRKATTSKRLWYIYSSRLEGQAIPHMNSLVSLKDLGEDSSS